MNTYEMERPPQEQETAAPERAVEDASRERRHEAIETEDALADAIREADETARTKEEAALQAADTRFAEVRASVSVTPGRADAIYEEGGFSARVSSFKERIIAAGASLKESLRGLLRRNESGETTLAEIPGTSLEVSENAAHEAGQTSEVPVSPEVSESITAEAPTDAEPVEEEWERERRERQEAREAKERDMRAYLEAEAYPALGLSVAAQERMCAEAPEEHRELLGRSFENVRDTVFERFLTETSEQVDTEATTRKQAEAFRAGMESSVRSRLREFTAEHNISFVDADALELPGMESRNEELGDRLRHAIGERVRAERDTVSKRAVQAALTVGEYKGFRNMTDEASDEEKEENYRRYKEVTLEETKEALVAQGLDPSLAEGAESDVRQPDWLKEFMQEAADRANEIRRTALDVPAEMKPPRDRGEVLKELQDATGRTDQSKFLSVNLKPLALEGLLESGSLINMHDMPEEQKRAHAGKMGMGADFYLTQRETVERALGTLGPDGGPTYGALCAENGRDEMRGGAPLYGDISIELEPEVMSRTVFTEGDSLSSGGNTHSITAKLERRGLYDPSAWGEKALARQIAPEHAPLAKALMDLEHHSEDNYLEAHIGRDDATGRAGVTLDDVRRIRVPRSAWEDVQAYVEAAPQPRGVREPGKEELHSAATASISSDASKRRLHGIISRLQNDERLATKIQFV